MHFRKIAVIYPDDAFGSAVLQGVEAALKPDGAEPVATASYVRQTSQVGDAIDKVRGANREGLIHAIESIHDLEVGLGPQRKLDYSAKDHKGFDHVIPTVVRGGKPVPFTD